MLTPAFFLQLGIALDVLILAITVFITVTSFSLYRLFRKPRYRQFSTGFLFISISYLFFMLINLYSYLQEYTVLFPGMDWEKLLAFFMQVRIIAMLLGLLLLIYLYYELNERGLQVLLASLVAAAFLLGGADAFAFLILSGILFLFVALKLYRHYRTSSEQSSLFVLMGFSLLFLAKLLSGTLFLHSGLYVGLYVFKLAGVALIARSLWVISR